MFFHSWHAMVYPIFGQVGLETHVSCIAWCQNGETLKTACLSRDHHHQIFTSTLRPGLWSRRWISAPTSKSMPLPCNRSVTSVRWAKPDRRSARALAASGPRLLPHRRSSRLVMPCNLLKDSPKALPPSEPRLFSIQSVRVVIFCNLTKDPPRALAPSGPRLLSIRSSSRVVISCSLLSCSPKALPPSEPRLLYLRSSFRVVIFCSFPSESPKALPPSGPRLFFCSQSVRVVIFCSFPSDSPKALPPSGPRLFFCSQSVRVVIFCRFPSDSPKAFPPSGPRLLLSSQSSRVVICCNFPSCSPPKAFPPSEPRLLSRRSSFKVVRCWNLLNCSPKAWAPLKPIFSPPKWTSSLVNCCGSRIDSKNVITFVKPNPDGRRSSEGEDRDAAHAMLLVVSKICLAVHCFNSSLIFFQPSSADSLSLPTSCKATKSRRLTGLWSSWDF